MTLSGLIRGYCLFWPVLVLLLAAWVTKPSSRALGSAFLAFLWALSSLLLLNLLADWQGWWKFSAKGGLLHGQPVDVVLGWAVLWGALPMIVLPRGWLWGGMGLALLVDLLLMPRCEPVIMLGPDWWQGEMVGLLGVLLPAQLLGRWTMENRMLHARAMLQFLGFGVLHIWVLPSVILEQTGGSWKPLLERPVWQQLLLAEAMVLVALPALAAVREFYERGSGTPVPFDPPQRLVRSGPYAYLANPMQTSMLLLYPLLGWALGNQVVCLIGVMVLVTGAGVAGWSETQFLRQRYGEIYLMWRTVVRKWIPRWRPHVPHPCRLYLSQTCQPCSGLWRWLERRSPVGLEILPAEAYLGPPLQRMRYEAPAWTEDGLMALTRALEHLNLGWAMVAWVLRLPIIRSLGQWIVDASGGGPRDLPRLGGTAASQE